MSVLVPTMSLTINIGLDGTGEHCEPTQKYDTLMSVRKASDFQLPKEPELSPVLLKKFREFRSDGRGFRWLILIYRHLLLFFIGEANGSQYPQQFGLGNAHLAAHLHFDFSVALNFGFLMPLQHAVNDARTIVGQLCGGYNHGVNIAKTPIIST